MKSQSSFSTCWIILLCTTCILSLMNNHVQAFVIPNAKPISLIRNKYNNNIKTWNRFDRTSSQLLSTFRQEENRDKVIDGDGDEYENTNGVWQGNTSKKHKIYVQKEERNLRFNDRRAFQQRRRRQQEQGQEPQTQPYATTNMRTTNNEISNVDIDGTRRRHFLMSMLAAATTATTLGTKATPAGAASGVVDESVGNVDDDDWPEGVINILKPPTDDRLYKAFKLDNGIKVVLCSDPSSNEGGAAMDVHVGASSDPTTIPGLAHFNEHMLFLGTADYPQEDSFEDFLAKNGGSSNAYTAAEDTVYYFSMQTADKAKSTKLLEGLKRFGSFFTSPLFAESATGRELNAIESEHSKNLQSDSFRIYQLEKGRQNPQHPHSRFFTGNSKTLILSNNLRQSLIDFYQTHYSANQMTLAVIGPQSLDTLEDMVNTAFGKIPNRHAPTPEEEWKRVIPPYLPPSAPSSSTLIPAYGHILKVVPVQDLRQVSISWPIIYNDEKDRTEALLSKQGNYVGHLLGHEGPNSLLSYLNKQRGWANSLTASGSSELSDYETFELVVGLTKSGFANVDKVIESIFSYLSMLRNNNIADYIFQEVLQLEELQWRFASKGDVNNYVQSLASSLQKYPPSLCVAGPRRLALCDENDNPTEFGQARTKFESTAQLDFTKRLTNEFCQLLTVDMAMITLMSKTFQGQTDKTEQWYGTEYRYDPIPESTLQSWRNCPPPKRLGIDFPKPNPFIPTEAGLRVKYPPPVINTAKLFSTDFDDRMATIPAPTVIRNDNDDTKNNDENGTSIKQQQQNNNNNNNNLWTVYYKPDDRFNQPKAFVVIQILNSELYSTSKNAALSNLYEVCVSDKLGEYAYDAGLAGLTYDVRVIPRGLRLTFGGYNDKLQEFATYICQKIFSSASSSSGRNNNKNTILPKDEIEFDRYKDIVSRSFAAFDANQPYKHASFFSNLIMTPTKFQYSNQDMRNAIDQTTLDDLVGYVKNQICSSSSAPTRHHCVGLVQGNLDEKEALTMISKIDKAITGTGSTSNAANSGNGKLLEVPPYLSPLPLPPITTTTTTTASKSTKQKYGTKLRIAEPNPENSNSASFVILQSLSTDPKEHVLMELLSAIVSEPFYEELRTKQQLGYIVSSGLKGLGKTRMLAFVVQSSIATNDKLTKEIFNYLDQVRPKLLNKLNDGSFAVYIKSLIDRKTEPDKQLATEVMRNWGEIANGRFQFNRIQQEVSALLSLEMDDLLQFWDTLYVQGNERRILVTELVPRTGTASSELPSKSMGYLSTIAEEAAAAAAAAGRRGDASVPITLGIDDIEQFRLDREALL